MIAEANLIGWMCMVRLAFEDGRTGFVPDVVSSMLVEKGWLEKSEEPDWEGHYETHVTDAGQAITDLHGPEWGINTIPVEEDSEK